MSTRTQFIVLVFAVLIIGLGWSDSAKADHPLGDFGHYPLNGMTNGMHMGSQVILGWGHPLEMPYAMKRIPTPPYFALHPPVYYSYPVPRTYGWSPFAYPGTFKTPSVALSDPREMINPHVKPDEQVPEKNSSTRTVSAPKLIINPYVVGTPGINSLTVARASEE